MSLRVVFMGTPEFSVPSLEALLASGYEVVGVFTQPDKPKGRGGRVQQRRADHEVRRSRPSWSTW